MTIKDIFYNGMMAGTIQRIPLPDYFETGLSRKLRPYQVDCFRNFLMYMGNDFDGKQARPHLLFQMATGSGKTLIMAGAMLYLYAVMSNFEPSFFGKGKSTDFRKVKSTP